MRKIITLAHVKTKKASQNITDSSDPTVIISLAELLANFPVRRPLYTHESGALCYQLLSQLRNNILPINCSKPALLTSLKYPTLANILLTETGSAFVKSNPVVVSETHTVQDWLIALAYTLRNHTLVINTPESDTFRTLIESLGCGYSSSGQLLERVHIWQTTCLFLCSLNTPQNAGLHDTDKLLETLHQRSNQAYNYQMCSGEMRQKLLSVTSNQSGLISNSPYGQCDLIRTKQHNDHYHHQGKQKQQQLIDCTPALTDREAFNCWVERWKFVNAEYLARQLIRHRSPNHVDALSRTEITLSPVRINSAPLQSCQQGPIRSNEPIPQQPSLFEAQNVTTELTKEPCTRSRTNPSDTTSFISMSATYMNTLKSMYTNLISRPLYLLLKNGLKDAREKFCPEATQQSSVISSTLNGLNRLLRNPSVHGDHQADVELGECGMDPKCNL